MNDRYLISAMRPGPFGALVPADGGDVLFGQVTEWHVVDRKTNDVVARCTTDRVACAVAKSLAAIAILEAIADDAELCRDAIAGALGIPCDTLKVAVAALLHDHARLADKLGDLEAVDVVVVKAAA